MVGGRAQEKDHNVRVEHFLWVHCPGKCIVIRLGQELEYTLENAPGRPRPLQSPHPPIIVGGSGERRTISSKAMCGVFDANRPISAPARAA